LNVGEGSKLIEVKDLRVSFFTPEGEIKAVDGISYALDHGEVMGIVGESGAGKSVGAYAIMGLIGAPGRVLGGEILFEGEDVLRFGKKRMRAFRGGEVSMIFQDPKTSLNPVFTVGNQLRAVYRAHNRGFSTAEAYRRVAGMLELAGISDAEKRMKQYPHELSGGLLQRVMIAMALICSPKLLIADEPTNSLDVTVQAQILELIERLRRETGMGVLFITHDLGAVAKLCDTVSVMYAGAIVEQGTVDDIFYAPAHPYTLGLLRSVPDRENNLTRRLATIEGAPADSLRLPAGCPFAPRCESCMSICLLRRPPFVELSEKHGSACWLCVRNRIAGGEEETPHE